MGRHEANHQDVPFSNILARRQKFEGCRPIFYPLVQACCLSEASTFLQSDEKTTNTQEVRSSSAIYFVPLPCKLTGKDHHDMALHFSLCAFHPLIKLLRNVLGMNQQSKRSSLICFGGHDLW